MAKKALIVGGGIGGLAAALACERSGIQVELFERAAEFSELGAGIQLGPNVVKVLHSWGLKNALAEVAAFPDRLRIRSATSGHELGGLRLGHFAMTRYGSPYATIHRADLHTVLLDALRQQASAHLEVDCTVTGFEQNETGVVLKTSQGHSVLGDVLVGADGVWSRVRQQLLQDGDANPTGHLAYRAMVPQKHLPPNLRSQEITAWLGPRLHAVQYPVRGGEWLNVVVIVHGQVQGDPQHWDHSANAAQLRLHLAASCAPLKNLVAAIEHWRLWGLSIRAPMQGAHEMAQGRVALLGDAAHPMVPYLAQGAGMAIEDANELGRSLAESDRDVTDALKRYAYRRWQRNARVQARAIRNGQIFHATGIVRWGRDVLLRLLGERLLDMPWLYKAP